MFVSSWIVSSHRAVFSNRCVNFSHSSQNRIKLHSIVIISTLNSLARFYLVIASRSCKMRNSSEEVRFVFPVSTRMKPYDFQLLDELSDRIKLIIKQAAAC